MSTLSRADILKLSVAERIELIGDIWDSICDCPESLSLTREQEADIDKRLEALDREPNSGSPWREVRERIQRGK